MALTWRNRGPGGLDDSGGEDREVLSASDALASVLESLHARVAVLDDRGLALCANPAGSHLEFADSLGLPAPKADAVNYLELCRIAGDAGSLEARTIGAGLDAVCRGTSDHLELDYQSAGSRAGRWLTLIVTPRPRAEPGALVLHRDATSTKLAEAAMWAVSARLLSEQDNQRHQLARELHDDVSQRLALLSFELQYLRDGVSSRADVAARAADLWQRTAEIATTVHDLTSRLHPLKLELLGLEAAIADIRRKLTSRHGIAISVTCTAVPEPLDRVTALHLLRIVEDGLANVVKHSAASHASVTLSGSADAIALVIADTGVGFDPSTVGASGLGLAAIRHRLELLGGSLRIHSQTGQGTRLEVTVPLTTLAETA